MTKSKNSLFERIMSRKLLKAVSVILTLAMVMTMLPTTLAGAELFGGISAKTRKELTT